jgi:Holliday junction resolvase
MTEQVIQKNIIQMLEKEYNAYVVKVQVASKSGIPDLLCCVEGLFLGIEVKRPDSKNNVSRLQQYNLVKIENSKGYSLVAWNVEMVRDFVEDMIV